MTNQPILREGGTGNRREPRAQGTPIPVTIIQNDTEPLCILGGMRSGLASTSELQGDGRHRAPDAIHITRAAITCDTAKCDTASAGDRWRPRSPDPLRSESRERALLSEQAPDEKS